MNKDEIKIDKLLLDKLYDKAREIRKRNKREGTAMGFRESLEIAINEIGLPSQEQIVRQRYIEELLEIGRQKSIEAKKRRAAETENWKKYNR